MEKKERDPRQLTAADVEVGVLQETAKAVKLRLWPKPERVRAILDEMYEPFRWCLGFATSAARICCTLSVNMTDDVGDIFVMSRAAMCPTEYRMSSDQARNEMDGAMIMAASLMGIGDAVMQLPGMVVRDDQVQINPVADKSGQRIARYTLADTLTPTNLVYDDAGNIVEVDFTRRDGGIVKWQKR